MDGRGVVVLLVLDSVYHTLLDFFPPFASTDMNVNTDAYVLDSYIIRDLPFPL